MDHTVVEDAVLDTRKQDQNMDRFVDYLIVNTFLGYLQFFVAEVGDQSIQDCGSQCVNKSSQSRGKLQPRRSRKSASSQSHEPQQAEFQFMLTPGIIPQHISGPDAALPRSDLLPNISFDKMVEDL
ncbi:Uncharacterized protein Fot_25147 [Forsythia ovata]|uniref:Uncharacterized protein n=1 Tax=Forsythia ovata TaxID=205694 RepID=A0ABD1U883_9LAMI